MNKKQGVRVRVRMVPFVEQDEELLLRASRRLGLVAEFLSSEEVAEEAKFVHTLYNRMLYESQVVSVHVSRPEFFPDEAKE